MASQENLDRKACENVNLSSSGVEYADLEWSVTIAKIADTDASTANANATTAVIPITRACEVTAARYAQAVSVANSATAYATVQLVKYTAASAGTVSATVAALSASTAATSIAARVGLDLTVVTSQARLAAGDCLHVVAAKTGSGQSLAIGTVTVRTRSL
jgi:hypothetical protein